VVVFGALTLLALGLLYSPRFLPQSTASVAEPAAAKIGPSFDRRPNVPRETQPGPRVLGSPAPLPGATAKPALPPAVTQTTSAGLPPAAVVVLRAAARIREHGDAARAVLARWPHWSRMTTCRRPT
jgi:hypothetical protein